MNTLWQDIRFGIRMLYKNWITSILVIAALGFGIGANTTIFSVMYSVLFMPLPMINPDQVVRVVEVKQGNNWGQTSAQNFLDWRKETKTLEGMFMVKTTNVNLAGYGNPIRISVYEVTHDFFTYTQIPMKIGRTFLAEDYQPGNSRVVILNHGFWKEQFGSDPSIINQAVLLDGIPYTVVGVMSSDMDLFESEARIWLPLTEDTFPEDRNDRRFNYTAVGWIKEGLSLEQVQEEFKVISSALVASYPEANKDWSIQVEPIIEDFYELIEQTFLVLYGAAGFLLLIVCSNVASLLLARASVRQKELSIRAALGAKRWQIIRQLLTESLALSLLGGLVGIFLTVWGIEILKSMLPPSMMSIMTSRGVDAGMLIFTLSISVFCGILFGLLPAWQASKLNLNYALKEGNRGTSQSFSKHRTLKTLVVAEVAMALVLLIGAGLMINSFSRLQKVDPGFTHKEVLTGHVWLDDNRYGEASKKRAFFVDIEQRLQNIPGVQSVGISNVVPVTWGEGISYKIDGHETNPNSPENYAEKRQINSAYFDTVGIPLLTGKHFTKADENVQNHKIIVNQKFAQDNWGDENPVGKYVRIPDWSDTPFEIIGMVGSIRHYGFNSGYEPELYIPYYTQPAEHISFAISSTQTDNEKLASVIRQEFWELDSLLPVNSIKTLEQMLNERVSFQRFGVIFLTIFSIVALLLSIMGVFGILSYTVSQQTHDIAVRMALGARENQVIMMVVKQGLTLTFTGLLIGLVLSYFLKQVLESQLYGISASDPLTYILITLILILVAAIACIIPARRAANVDPMTALRCE